MREGGRKRGRERETENDKVCVWVCVKKVYQFPIRYQSMLIIGKCLELQVLAVKLFKYMFISTHLSYLGYLSRKVNQ